MEQEIIAVQEEVDELYYKLPKEQIDRVFNQDMCDIDPMFMGFTKIYKNLSEVIPKHFTVIDLGCAYNPQCFYFKDHLKYISVDVDNGEVFKTENNIHYTDGIMEFINTHLPKLELNLEETFAICSYVPDWYGLQKIKIRETFHNLFIYYPHGEFKEKVFRK